MTIELNDRFALIAGIYIFALPKLRNYIAAVYLILVGLVGIFNS